MGALPATAHNENALSTSSSSSIVIEKAAPDAGHAPHAEHGALIDHKVPQDDAVPAHPELWWSKVRRHLREPFSEFFGTLPMLLVKMYSAGHIRAN